MENNDKKVESLAGSLLKKVHQGKKEEPKYNPNDPNDYYLSHFAGQDKRKEPKDTDQEYWTGGRRDKIGEEDEE